MMDIDLLEQQTEVVRRSIRDLLQGFDSNAARGEASRTWKMLGDAIKKERAHRESVQAG